MGGTRSKLASTAISLAMVVDEMVLSEAEENLIRRIRSLEPGMWIFVFHKRKSGVLEMGAFHSQTEWMGTVSKERKEA